MQSTAMTVAEHKSDFKLTKEVSYLTLQGELWGVYCDNLGGNWPYYNSIALYICMCKGFAIRMFNWKLYGQDQAKDLL